MNDQTSSIQFFRQIFGGAWVTQAIFASAELGIADLLASGPLGINELAERTGTNSSALYRLLRALASAGVFAE
ncbi:MAG TPA: methyltransferase dimerization domain-containing protein, partial [Oligoflexia bacterium]|nr:methyltransferase dimerization domain-containing protein [Oligoflexia bacterium]